MSTRIVFSDIDGLSLFGTVKLAKLIEALERHRHAENGDDNRVIFDFGGLSTTRVDSYRGYYDHLALGFNNHPPMTVNSLIRELESALGRCFKGYKGGEYIMGAETPVWVSNIGYASGTAIVGLLVEFSMVTILTEYVP